MRRSSPIRPDAHAPTFPPSSIAATRQNLDPPPAKPPDERVGAYAVFSSRCESKLLEKLLLSENSTR